MITKNKHSPATLYLLNAKNINKLQQQRKSARLTFNKKKSSRSISQYQKWNPSQNKDTSNNSNNANNNVGQIFQPSSRTNSEIKKIVLSRNQFGLQPMPLEKKLSSIIQIFNNNNYTGASKRVNTVSGQFVEKDYGGRKAQQNKSGQLSLLSLKQVNDKQFQRHSRSRSKFSHVRTQSMLNHSDQQNTSIQSVLSKIEKKFKSYQKLTQGWKIKYSMQQNDYLIDQMLKIFKSLFNEVVGQFTNHVMGNLQYFEDSITSVAKQYEIQIATLREEISKNDNANIIIDSLMKTVKQKHYKGVTCSQILEDIQLNGTDIEHLVKNSLVYDEILKIHEKQTEWNAQIFRIPTVSHILDINVSKLHKSNSDEDFYEQQRLDYVQNDSNWNHNFQNRQSIKGVLKYIHNHNQNKFQEKEPHKANLNSTGYIVSSKTDKSDMKIQNWKSFQDKSISQYKKIMSQR